MNEIAIEKSTFERQSFPTLTDPLSGNRTYIYSAGGGAAGVPLLLIPANQAMSSRRTSRSIFSPSYSRRASLTL
jgi:hypothetical protein